MKTILRITKYLLAITALLILSGILFVVRPFVFWVKEVPSKVEADVGKLEEHVNKISKEFYPRSWEHIENLDKTALYIKNEFASYNTRVSFQNYAVDSREYRNVISEHGEDESARIIVGAHYDAYSNLPAADDNASGIAGLLELNRLLSVSPVKVPVTLVAYTLEEPPFFRDSKMGSSVHSNFFKSNNIKVRLMICLEMIGYFSDEENSQDYPLPILNLLYPTKGDFIAIVDKLNWSLATLNIKKAFLVGTSLPAVSINAPQILPGIDFSDHLNYWNDGYEAVMITDTAFFRNKAYHTENDIAERLDYDRMGEVVKGIYGYLDALE